MKSYLNISAALLSALLFAACGNDPKTPDREPASQETELQTQGMLRFTHEELEGLQLVELSQHEFPNQIQATGYMDVPPANRASINALMGGYVKSFSLIEGQEVSKGDVLLTLENTSFVELQQEYLEVVEQLKYLQSDYQRQQTMFEENISSHKTFLKSESDYKTAVARKNGLREKLRMLNLSPEAVEQGKISSEVPIYTPLDGKVSKVFVTRGTYVSPTQPIAEIIDSNKLLLELQLFERDILNVQEGQHVRFSTPEISPQTFMAEVSLVGRAVDSETRSITVHASIPDSISNRFAAGMFINAQVQAQPLSHQSLPEEAIRGTGENARVLAVHSREQDHISFETIAVTRGRMTSAHVEIKNAEALAGKEILIGEVER